ncbi:MAG: helix-turn-helix transcriptional regulator [Rhodobacteraceae bacterium]|nr:helix-turn-helix transcriptional regulator [Paracoccaceae bacterium]
MPNHVEYLPNPDAPPTGIGFDLTPGRPVIARREEFRVGYAVEPHSHPRAQLAMCYNGVMRLQAGEDVWIIPHKHAIWIPPDVEHQLSTQGPVLTHHLYVAPSYVTRAGLPQKMTVLRTSPLLRGVVERMVEGGLAKPEVRRLAWVALDEIGRLRPAAMHLPGGRDPRLVAAMGIFLRHPEERRGLAEIAHEVGTSERTLARLFVTETGKSFRDWRARRRILFALERLEQGESSTDLAAHLGYSSPSAFIAAFKRDLGAPPSAFRG